MSANIIENVLKMHCTCTETAQICQNRFASLCVPYYDLCQIIVNIVTLCGFLNCLIHTVQIMVAPGHMTFMTGALHD